MSPVEWYGQGLERRLKMKSFERDSALAALEKLGRGRYSDGYADT